MTKLPLHVLAAAVVFSAVNLSAQTVAAPVAGIVLNSQGRLLAVRGLLANLMPGMPLTLPAGLEGQAFFGVAFFGSGGVIKTAAEVIAVSASGAMQSRTAAPDGPALFAFDPPGQSLQWIYFAGSGTLQNADASVVFDASAWGDAVIALGAAASGVLPVLARSGSQLWAESISITTGAILSRVPINGNPPGVAFEAGWLVGADGGLDWQSASGTQPAHHIPLPESPRTLQTSALHSAAVNGRWLVNGNWQLVEIPVNSTKAALRRGTLPRPEPRR